MLALSVLVGSDPAAVAFVPDVSASSDRSAAASSPAESTPQQVARTFGPDCRQHPNAVARADELMAGSLKLSRHAPTRLRRNPTWSENPFGDSNWQFQYHSLRFVWDLFEAWRITGTERYRDRGLFLVRDWVRDNPPGGGRSPFSWNDHSTAIRTWVLACAAVVAPRTAWVREALRVHGSVLADPDFYVDHGNHALNQSRGLLAAGCILGRRDWQRLAARRIGALIVESVDRQGVTNEQSVYYQIYNLQAYRAAAERLRACGMDVPRSFRRLDLMPDLLTHATLPDGTYVTLGDTSHNKAISIPGTTAAYAASKGREGPLPAQRSAVFDAGFAFGRTGWGGARPFDQEAAFSARFGPARSYHGHLDHGAVTLYGYGSRLVDDPGQFSANFTQWRRFAISRAAHNVITVDDVAYAPSSTATIGGVRMTPTHDDLTIHDPGYEGVDLQRRIVFSRGLGWLLIDDHATSEVTRTYRQLWHLLPGSDPQRLGSTVRTRQDGGNLAILQLRAPDRTRIVKGGRSPLQGWYSKTLNKWKRAPTIEAIRTGRSVRYVTLLVPIRRADSVVRVAGLVIDGPRVQFQLSVDGRREWVVIGRTDVTVTTLRSPPPRGNRWRLSDAPRPTAAVIRSGLVRAPARQR
jgi:hypothetical protein